MKTTYAILDENEQTKFVTLEEWAKWMGNHRDDRVIGRARIDDYIVSTIFLGLDFDFADDGRPQYWETKIFDPPGDRKHSSGRAWDLGTSIYQERYSTAREAKQGHAKAIEWLRGKLKK